jgi:AcrR family transcriptional regulator
MNPGESGNETRRSSRERLIVAVIAAVAERGYRQTTVADILVRADVPRATYYELFADKEECFLAAYDDLVERLSSTSRASTPAPSRGPNVSGGRLGPCSA